jgi:hypothetical protein
MGAKRLGVGAAMSTSHIVRVPGRDVRIGDLMANQFSYHHCRVVVDKRYVDKKLVLSILTCSEGGVNAVLDFQVSAAIEIAVLR